MTEGTKGVSESLSHWDEHPEYPLDDWKHEVANDDTRLGYMEWIEGREAEEADDEAE